MSPWLCLTLAGLFEIGFTTCLKLSNGQWFNRWGILFVVCAVASFGLLEHAIKSISLGVAYAVWTGLGAAGTAIVGVMVFGDSFSWIKGLLLLNLLGSALALKFFSGH